MTKPRGVNISQRDIVSMFIGTALACIIYWFGFNGTLLVVMLISSGYLGYESISMLRRGKPIVTDTSDIAWPLSFEPSGDGMPACIHDANGAIICSASYADFEADVTRPERAMKRFIELANRRSVTG